MSYNNDEQARRAQAAQNNQWASSSSQPQNFAPYQTGTYSNPNESIIHTTGTVPMNLLNSPSSHSIPGLPHNPAPLRRTYQNPNRQEDLRRVALENRTYNQGESSRGYPGVGYSAQPPNYYPQAPRDPGPGPSGSQTTQTHMHQPMSYPVGRQAPPSNRDEERERDRNVREERKRNGKCPECGRPAAPGRTQCETHLARNIEKKKKRKANGKCYTCGYRDPLTKDGKCQHCIDDAAAAYQSRK